MCLFCISYYLITHFVCVRNETSFGQHGVYNWQIGPALQCNEIHEETTPDDPYTRKLISILFIDFNKKSFLCVVHIIDYVRHRHYKRFEFKEIFEFISLLFTGHIKKSVLSKYIYYYC